MQVKTVCTAMDQKVYGMTNAILLYKDGQNNPVFASIHDVHVSAAGIPNIQAGTPVSKTGLIEMLKTLAPQDFAQPELLGNHILARGNDHLAWFCKPQKRSVYFKCNQFGGEVSAQTEHPGLVFIVGKGKWYVFAVKSRTRPTASTPLYVAPYMNVWSGGHICVGNIETPKGEMRFNTEAWNNAFFRSKFSHPNVHGANELTYHEGGIFELWRSLMTGQKFDSKSLVPAGETLGEAFERAMYERH